MGPLKPESGVRVRVAVAVVPGLAAVQVDPERLEQELGRPMRWFAYPVGARDSFTAQTQRILEERGVRLAFSFYGGLASYAHWNALDVPRIHVGASHSPELLQAMLSQFVEWFDAEYTVRYGGINCADNDSCAPTSFADGLLSFPGVTAPLTPSNQYAMTKWEKAENGGGGCPGQRRGPTRRRIRSRAAS